MLRFFFPLLPPEFAPDNKRSDQNYLQNEVQLPTSAQYSGSTHGSHAKLTNLIPGKCSALGLPGF